MPLPVHEPGVVSTIPTGSPRGSTGPRPAHGFGQVLYNVSGSVVPAGKHLQHGVEGERPDDSAHLVRVE